MRHEDFRIGEHFYRAYLHIDEWAWSKWRCTDIGTRVITAIRVDTAETVTYRPGQEPERRTYTEAEALAAGLFRGPPYSPPGACVRRVQPAQLPQGAFGRRCLTLSHWPLA